MTIAALIHQWEGQGLGQAPFKCVGLYSLPSRALAENNPQAYQSALTEMPAGFDVGTCAVCGIALTNNFLIRARCGRQFSVGCDCVKKAGDAGLIDAVHSIKLAAERDQRARDREAERESRLDAQRIKNGGLTDWEVQEAQRKSQQQDEASLKLLKGQAIKSLVQPIIDALEAKPTPFALDMVNLLKQGELPSGRAMDITRAIYAEAFALSTTGKSRGAQFKAAKEQGKEQASIWFQSAASLLKHP